MISFQRYNTPENQSRTCLLYKEGRKYKQLIVVNKLGGLDLINVPKDTELFTWDGGNPVAHQLTLERLAAHDKTQLKAKRAVKALLKEKNNG